MVTMVTTPTCLVANSGPQIHGGILAEGFREGDTVKEGTVLTLASLNIGEGMLEIFEKNY